MPDLAVRTQRLRTLENDIRKGLLEGAEAWYYAGIRLKEIRDDELWKDAGFPSWWKYLESGRLDVDPAHACRLIKLANYRHAISNNLRGAQVENKWSQRAFAELLRLKPEDAPRVAKKIEAAFAKKVEAAPKEEKEAMKLSREFARAIVSRELPIKEPRQPKPEPLPPDDDQDDNGNGNVHQYLGKYTGEIEGMRRALEGVPQAGWMLLCRNWKREIKLLIIASRRLADFLEGQC